MATGILTFNANIGSSYTYKNLTNTTIQTTATNVSGTAPDGAIFTGATIKINNVYCPNETEFNIDILNAKATFSCQNNGHAVVTANLKFDDDIITQVKSGTVVSYWIDGKNVNFHAPSQSIAVVTFTITYSYTAPTPNYQPSIIDLETYNRSTKLWEDIVAPVDLNGSTQVRVKLTNAYQSEMTHTITWTCGANTVTQSLDKGISESVLTQPLKWNEAFPNTENGQAYCRVQTQRNGSSVGSLSSEFNVHVPSSLVPTTGDISTSLYTTNAKVRQLGFYVQTLSGVKVVVSNSAGIYGSTIRYYLIDGVTTTQPQRTIESLTSSGTKEISVVCIDSRGRASSAKKATIEVEQYYTPSLSSIVAVRANSAGEAAPKTGTYCELQANASYASVRGNNDITISVSYKEDVSTEAYKQAYASIEPMTTYLYGSNDSTAINYFSPSKTYLIRFIAVDSFGQTTQKIVPLGTTSYTMFFKRGGNGVGFGMETETSTNINAIEISDEWSILHGGYTVPRIIYSSTEPTGHPGLIWLKQE